MGQRADAAHERIRAIAGAARADGRSLLLESEGFEVARALGLAVPVARAIGSADDVGGLDLSVFPGDRVVLKVLAPDVAHKSERGGVRVVAKEPAALRREVAAMAERLGDVARGFTVQEFVAEAAAGFGSESLLGVRSTEEFGPIIAFGPGGVHAEMLARRWLPGSALVLSARDELADETDSRVRAQPWLELITEPFRGRPPLVAMTAVVALLERFARAARALVPDAVAELEINPVVFRGGAPVALDVLVRPGAGPAGLAVAARAAPRPIHKIDRLLHPRSIAVIGVSRDPTRPGHALLANLIQGGFARADIWVVKPDCQTIDGCACVADVESLPAAVDLAFVSVDAAQAPGQVTRLVRARKAESIVLIPGGLEELGAAGAGAGALDEMGRALAQARASDWGGPVMSGGNCLGVRSIPGRVNGLFLAPYKMRRAPAATEPTAPLAIVAQSGALMAALLDRWPGAEPRYAVSVGNQSDLTIGDYLAYFRTVEDVRVIAVYAEGFRPLDGARFLDEARALTRAGRAVVVYRAGRTRAGARASVSHTASVAGDYAVFGALAARAGALVADTLDDFRDLALLCARLHAKDVRGLRLGAVSNAGFECVAFADRAGAFSMAEFSAETRATAADILAARGLDKVVAVHDPLDLTPMLDDAGFADIAAAVLADDGVDAAIIGCVPMTGALCTLAPDARHGEDLDAPGALVGRLIALFATSDKPWVAVVDGGARYQAMRARLAAAGVPVSSSADRALTTLEAYCRWRVSRSTP